MRGWRRLAFGLLMGLCLARVGGAPYFEAAAVAASTLEALLAAMCKDKLADCKSWAPLECERNRDFMFENCQGSCGVCVVNDMMAKGYTELALYGLRNARLALHLQEAAPARELRESVELLAGEIARARIVANSQIPYLIDLLKKGAALLHPFVQEEERRGMDYDPEAEKAPLDVSNLNAIQGARNLPTVVRQLANGHSMPQVAFGTWMLTGDACYKAVADALQAGYRHIDTAEAYQNEAHVGAAWKDSGLDREELFLATKLSVASFGAMEARVQLEEQLDNLQTDYIDLYMLHGTAPDPQTLLATWVALEDAQRKGKIRSLGVSNFNANDLKALLDIASVPPMVVQNKMDAYHHGITFNADGVDLIEFCNVHDIVLMGYSPLNAWPFQLSAVMDPHVSAVAARLVKSPSQVLLRWALQRGAGVVTRSTNPDHMAESIALFDFALPKDEMLRIDGLSWFTSALWNHPTRMLPNIFDVDTLVESARRPLRLGHHIYIRRDFVYGIQLDVEQLAIHGIQGAYWKTL